MDNRILENFVDAFGTHEEGTYFDMGEYYAVDMYAPDSDMAQDWADHTDSEAAWLVVYWKNDDYRPIVEEFETLAEAYEFFAAMTDISTLD